MADRDRSFVTVIISAHGKDLKSDIATPSQVRTLRKFTVAGKCGHLNYVCPSLDDTIFDISLELARAPHIPFTEKLKILKTEVLKHDFNEELQEAYERQPAEVKAKNTSRPRAFDWFATSQVRYNHMYSFRVNNPAVPWERDEFGIWLVDGSPHILLQQQEMQKRLRSYNPKISAMIMHHIGLPAWDFEISLFELANILKRFFHVKYVNFIDLSCRFREVDRSWTSRIKAGLSSLIWSDDVPSAELSDITPRAGVEQPTIEMNGMEMVIMDYQPRRMPAGWFYVQNIRENTYLYVNPSTGEVSVDFPDFPHAPRPNIFVQGIEMEIVDPKISGFPRELPPGWEYVRILRNDKHLYVNTTTGEMNPFFPGERKIGGSKRSYKQQTKKRTKKRKNK
jgi:hypothetical protein